MGKLQLFAINFNNNRQVFYPGEQLSGYVVVDLREPMEARGLRIEFEGKSYCHWTEQHGSGDNRRTEHYTGREKLFEFVIPLCGSFQSGGSRVILQAGQQTYPFAFNIPFNMPSSFEGRIGHIRYELKAEIDRPWRFDHKVKRPIIINEIIDTNLPQYNVQVGGTQHKDVGCMCCASGPIEMAANVDRACYCPGETILITADIQNNTTRDMTALKGKLVRSIAYHSSRKTKHVEEVVAKIEGAAIPRGEFAKWANQPLGIPALSPSIFNSRVVNVNYYVAVEVDVPWGMDPNVKMPITMGTVPYRPVYNQQQPQIAQPPVAPSAPDTGMAPPPPSVFGYPDMAPPSYSSVVGGAQVNIGDENDKYTQGNLSYMPVYTFAQPYQGSITHQPGAYPPPVPPPQQGGEYPPPQQPGMYPPPQQPGVYPPPQQPGVYPPPQQPGVYPPPQGVAPAFAPNFYPPAPIQQQPGGSFPPAMQEPPSYNPNSIEAAPISKPPLA